MRCGRFDIGWPSFNGRGRAFAGPGAVAEKVIADRQQVISAKPENKYFEK